MPAMPELPTQQIIDTVNAKFEEFKGKYEAKLEEIKSEWEAKKAVNQDYDVIGQTGKVLATLNKKTQEKKVKLVACLLALEDGFAEDIASEVWEVVEPIIDGARPDGMIDMMWDAGKSVIKKGVDSATETAVKTALEALVPGSSSSVVVKGTPAEAPKAKSAKAAQPEKKKSAPAKNEVASSEPAKQQQTQQQHAKQQAKEPQNTTKPVPVEKVSFV